MRPSLSLKGSRQELNAYGAHRRCKMFGHLNQISLNVLQRSKHKHTNSAHPTALVPGRMQRPHRSQKRILTPDTVTWTCSTSEAFGSTQLARNENRQCIGRTLNVAPRSEGAHGNRTRSWQFSWNAALQSTHFMPCLGLSPLQRNIRESRSPTD